MSSVFVTFKKAEGCLFQFGIALFLIPVLFEGVAEAKGANGHLPVQEVDVQ